MGWIINGDLLLALGREMFRFCALMAFGIFGRLIRGIDGLWPCHTAHFYMSTRHY